MRYPNRKVFHLSDEEAAVIEQMRQDKQTLKRNAAFVACKYQVPGYTRCPAKAKESGYCGNHLRMPRIQHPLAQE